MISSLQLFHDLGTYPLDVLLEREILKTMQSLYSYDKPRDLKMYFEQKTYDHEIHFLRHRVRFDVPLIKSTRLSCSPIFAFPNIYNSFPDDFIHILERKLFLEKLSEY